MSKDNHVIFSNINKNIELIIVSNKTRMIIDPWIYGEIWCKSPCLISANNKNARLILGLNDYKTGLLRLVFLKSFIRLVYLLPQSKITKPINKKELTI